MTASFQIPDAYFKVFGIPAPEREHRFCPSRRWRIDFAWPVVKLAVEIEGAIFAHGRHTRGIGFMKDTEKYNALAESGWSLLRYEPHHIDYEQIKRVYEIRKENE